MDHGQIQHYSIVFFCACVIDMLIIAERLENFSFSLMCVRILESLKQSTWSTCIYVRLKQFFPA